MSFIHAEINLIHNYLADWAKDKPLLPQILFFSLPEDWYEVFLFQVIMNFLNNKIFQRP